MNAVIRLARGVLFVAAIGALGLVLRWATAGTLGALSADDFGSLARLVAGGVAWAAYAWPCLAVAVTVLERLPGTLGRAAATISAGITSDASRALLRSTLGVAAAAPLTVGVAHATPTGGDPHSVQALWAPVEKASSVPLKAKPLKPHGQAQQHGPARRQQHGPVRRQPRGPAEQPGGPVSWDPRGGSERPSTVRIGDPAGAQRTQPRLAIPDRPTTGAATRYTPIHPTKTKPVKPAKPAKSTKSRRPAQSVIVQRGDSLWSIAATELGPGASDAAIAARWPQWYAANAERIGPDPDLVCPGQVLKAPLQQPRHDAHQPHSDQEK